MANENDAVQNSQLYNVTIEYEVVVLAKSEDDACDAAEDACHSGDLDQPHIYASPMSHLPGDWDTDCLPFCADGADCEDGETIAVLIARGCAPRYKKTLALCGVQKE